MEVRTTVLGAEENDGLNNIEREVVSQTRKKIEAKLPNGRKIVFQKPTGAVSLKIARFLGDDSRNEMLNIYYRMLMCIIELDGVRLSAPGTKLEIEALADRLGEDFDDACVLFAQPQGEEPAIAEQLFGSMTDAKK